jgi:hypothetical protein
MKRLIIVALLVLLSPSTTKAEWKGSDLAEYCDGTTESLCTGYVIGAFEGLSVANFYFRAYCIPDKLA